MRFLTTEPMDAVDVACFTAADDWKKAIENAHCWVWQEAETREQAIAQHVQKHNDWEADINAGRPEKLTY